MTTRKPITQRLQAAKGGKRQALDEVLPLVYDELRALARAKLRYERSSHTFNTTALVHEAYIKLARLDRIEWQSKGHILALAAQAMRQVLVNYARRRGQKKRAGVAAEIPLEEAEMIPADGAARVLAIDDALRKLEAMNPRHARIVECRIFGGLPIEETAAALEISPATVKRDWTLLRAWLRRELADPP